MWQYDPNLTAELQATMAASGTPAPDNGAGMHEGAIPEEATAAVADEGVTTPAGEAISPPGPPQAAISSINLLARVRARSDDRRNLDIWGPYLRAGLVTLLVGETSAGKTVFTHNLGYHLAAYREFLQITPRRPFRVLHVDYESYEDVYEEHLTKIGATEGWDFLEVQSFTDDYRGGPKLLDFVARYVTGERYDAVIFDSIAEAYPVEDESSTEDANRQMLAFRKLARTTNAGVLVTHNSGLRTYRKTKVGRERIAEQKFFGRGATARADRADIVMNLIELEEDVRLLSVPKSRGRGYRDRIEMQFAGRFGYELVADGIAAPPTGDSVSLDPDEPTALEKILVFLAGQPGGKASRADIEKAAGVARSSCQGALNTGVKRGLLPPPSPEHRGLWGITKSGRAEASRISANGGQP